MGDLPDSIGPYQIVGKLGEGGMGAVYEGLHKAISRRVAIKVLHPEYSSNPDVIARFFNEARAVNIVDHPGLVQVSDYAQLPDGTAYIVMEFLKGESLGRRLKRAPGQMPLNEILYLGWQIADSLAAAHEKKIIHRDLKPDNVMIVPDPHMASGERTKLVDFGLAKLAEAGLVKTRSNQVMGTPSYMSPEQCAGAGKVDDKTDVYALGCMLYLMLSGRPPFVAPSPGQLLSMQMLQAPEPLQSRVPELPPKIAEFVDRLLEKDKARRPTMKKVATQLETLAKLAPPLTKHSQDPEEKIDLLQTQDLVFASSLGSVAAQSTPSRRRRLGVTVVVGITLLAMVIGAGRYAYRSIRAPARPPESASPPEKSKGAVEQKPAPLPAPAPAPVAAPNSEEITPPRPGGAVKLGAKLRKSKPRKVESKVSAEDPP